MLTSLLSPLSSKSLRVARFPRTPHHEPNRQHKAETYRRTGNAIHKAKIREGIHCRTCSPQGHLIRCSAPNEAQKPQWAKLIRCRNCSALTFIAARTRDSNSPLVLFPLVLCTLVSQVMERTRVDFNVPRHRAQCARHFRGVLLSFSPNPFSSPVGDELVRS